MSKLYLNSKGEYKSWGNPDPTGVQQKDWAQLVIARHLTQSVLSLLKTLHYTYPTITPLCEKFLAALKEFTPDESTLNRTIAKNQERQTKLR